MRADSDGDELRLFTRDTITRELCEHSRDGARCIRDKGHDGAHELLSIRDGLYSEPREAS